MQIDPLEEKRQDYRTAFIASLISNIAIRALGKKGAKLTKMEDFVIEWDGQKPKEQNQSMEDMKRIMMSIAAAANKKETKLRTTPPKGIKK